MKSAENHRYEDQFFQFDQTWYENKYSAPRVNHPITSNAEPDFGNDLVNENSASEELSNADSDSDQDDNNLFEEEEEKDSFYQDEDGTSPNRNL